MRGTIGLLLASSLFLAFATVQSVAAGTEANPEITDAVGDQQISLVSVPECVQGICEFSGGADLVAGWIAGETATEIHFFLKTSSACPGSITTYTYIFNFKIGLTAYKASAVCNNLIQGTSTPLGDGKITPGDLATAATLVGTNLDLTVPISKLGAPGVITATFATAAGKLISNNVPWVDDRAPNTGFGKDYAMSGAAGGNSTGSGNTTGMGNMTKSGSSSTSSSSETSGTSASTSHSQTTTATTTTTTQAGGTTTSVPVGGNGLGAGPRSALDKIQADSGYAVASATAMGAVVLISLVGLFWRWGA